MRNGLVSQESLPGTASTANARSWMTRSLAWLPICAALVSALLTGCDEGGGEGSSGSLLGSLAGDLIEAEAERLLRSDRYASREVIWEATMGGYNHWIGCEGNPLTVRFSLPDFRQRNRRRPGFRTIVRSEVPDPGELEDDRERVRFIEALEDAGFIGPRSFSASCESSYRGNCDRWGRRLTARVRQGFIQQPVRGGRVFATHGCTLPLGELGPARVTRISHMNDETAEAEYERSWQSNETHVEFVRRWSSNFPRFQEVQPQTGSRRFQRWEDGWRLQ